MTDAEIRAVWERFSHRADVTADLDVVAVLAGERIRSRLMIWGDPFPDQAAIDDSKAMAPQLWISAGLIELHRLAQDDNGMSREATVFEGAAQDFMMRRSLDTGPAEAVRSDWDGN